MPGPKWPWITLLSAASDSTPVAGAVADHGRAGRDGVHFLFVRQPEEHGITEQQSEYGKIVVLGIYAEMARRSAEGSYELAKTARRPWHTLLRHSR